MFISYKKIIAFVVTPSENYGIFCHLGGYDKGFYGINIWENIHYRSNTTLPSIDNHFESDSKIF